MKLGNHLNHLKKAKLMRNRRTNQICRVKNFYNCFLVFIKIVHVPFDEMMFLENGLKN